MRKWYTVPFTSTIAGSYRITLAFSPGYRYLCVNGTPYHLRPPSRGLKHEDVFNDINTDRNSLKLYPHCGAAKLLYSFPKVHISART